MALHARGDRARRLTVTARSGPPEWHDGRVAEERRPDPVLITDAARSYEEELEDRKRRYAVMMGMRVPCMVLAAVFYQTPWLAVTLLVISIPLPWMAVLIANDRLPRKSETVNRYRADRRSLEARRTR